jgi:uncharacterized protein (DUF58 family)
MPIQEERATDEDAIAAIDAISMLRLVVEERSPYDRVLRYVAEGKWARLDALIVEATDIPDEDVFEVENEDEEWTVVGALYEHLAGQAEKLRRRGVSVHPLDGLARPGLHLFRPDDPVFDVPEQLHLPGIPPVAEGNGRDEEGY